MTTVRRYRTWLADSARWDGFEFRPGDVVISTPSKCGTTWMQMICALLILGDPALPRPLTELSPWLDIRTDSVRNVFATLAAQPHRRFIKTHTPLDGLPFDDRVTYVCVGRDPRDVAISSQNHGAVMNGEVLQAAAAESPPPAAPGGPVERFWRWVEDQAPPAEGLALLLHHVGTFWDRRAAANVVLVHYDDLRSDLDGEMRRLAARIGVPVDEGRWPALVAEAGFDRMRARAAELAPQVTMPGLWHDPAGFFHQGTTGQWQSLIGDEEPARYWSRVHRLARPGLAAWLHRGATPERGGAPGPAGPDRARSAPGQAVVPVTEVPDLVT